MANAIDAFFQAGGAWLKSLNPNIPDVYVDNGSSYTAAWFVDPVTHFRDVFIASAFFIPMLAYAIMSGSRSTTGGAASWVEVIPAKPEPVSHAAIWSNKHKENITHGPSSTGSREGAAVPDSPVSTSRRDREEVCTSSAVRTALLVLDYILRALTTICFCAIIYYKTVIPNRWGYLLMPCHIQNAILVYLSFAPRASRTSAALWTISLYTYFGTFLALALPDTRNQDMPFELINFWTEHVVLLLLPCVWLIRRRYALPGGLRPFIIAWASFALQESHLHLAASLATGFNIVYVMVPSKPQMRLHGTGGAYRYWFVFLELPLLILFSRYVIVEAIVAFSGLNRFRTSAAPVAEPPATEAAATKHIDASPVAAKSVDAVAAEEEEQKAPTSGRASSARQRRKQA